MSLAGQSNLVCRFFTFITLNITCHSPLARVSAKKSDNNLMRVPCMLFVAFNIFCQFDYYVYGHVPPRVDPVWQFLHFLGFGTVSFCTLGKFSVTISSNIFSGPFSPSPPSGTSIRQMLVHLTLSQVSNCPHFFSFFFLYSFIQY